MLVQSFWGRDRRLAYFDAKVLNPFAPFYASSPLTQCYRHTELDKRQKESVKWKGEPFLL